MAGSLNKVTLIGNLGADPEVKSMNGGDRVANFTLATSESWTDKSTGEKKERTQWHKIVCFNSGIIGVLEKYAKKGAKVFIEGQLEHRKFTDKDGVDRYTTEVVLRPYHGELLLLSGGNSSGNTQDYRKEQYEQGNTYGGGNTQPRDDMADDIPF